MLYIASCSYFDAKFSIVSHVVNFAHLVVKSVCMATCENSWRSGKNLIHKNPLSSTVQKVCWEKFPIIQCNGDEGFSFANA